MKLLTILIILLLLPITIAQEEVIPLSIVNIDDSVNWIMKQPLTSAIDASLATLAATKSDVVDNQKAAQKLLDLKNSRQDCWPSTNCNTKDTALAILALKRTGNTISTRWLKAQEKPNTEGKWYLQVDTQATGNCNVKYGDKTKVVQVEEGRIKSELCPSSTQLSLSDCLQSNLLSDKTSLAIVVACSQLGTGKISLIHKVDEKYFITDEVSSNVYTTLKIKNSNFEDYESTLYASWALKEIGEDVNSIVWLKRFYTPSIETSALMYLITEEELYLTDLLIFQDENTGAFGTVFETSLATLALRKQGSYMSEVDFTKIWLESRMLEDSSWNKDIKDTSMAIYGVFGSLDIDLTPRISQPSSTATVTCNENGMCETFLGETSINCIADCSCGDAVCDTSEDEISCEIDCKVETECAIDEDCDMGYTCDYGNCVEEQPECTFDSDCPTGFVCENEECEEEKGGGFLFFFIILIILAILGGAGYFYYKNFYLTGKKIFKFKSKTPPLLKQQTKIYKGPNYQQVYKAQPKRKTLAEKQLEKSLQEAKKLFKK